MRLTMCACICMCICVVPACYCVRRERERETLITCHILASGGSSGCLLLQTLTVLQGWTWREMKTCVTASIQMEATVALGLAQVSRPRWQAIQRSVEPLKYCCLTTAAPRLHQLTAAMRLHDADKAQKVTWKGTVPFGRELLFLEASGVISWDSEGGSL